MKAALLRWLAIFMALPWVFSAIKFLGTRCPADHIYGGGTVYMYRWRLIEERRWLPFSIRLHHIVRPDMDRHLHDHPFDYRTFVLKGWYAETVRSGLRRLAAGDTFFSPVGRLHRISHVGDGGAWTLFVMGRNNDRWGFLVDGRMVDRKDYE